MSLLDFSHDDRGPRREDLAGLRQPHALGRAHHEFGADLFFQLAQRLGQRRLRHVQDLRGGAHAASPGQGEQQVQMLESQAASPADYLG